MREIQIDSKLKEQIPQAMLACLTCRVKTEKSSPDLLKQIGQLERNLQESMEIPQIQEKPHILETRQAYKILGKDFRRYRNSSEAMHRRILQGKGLYQINNVVECNNYLSIRSGYSMGTYDLCKLQGKISWTVSMAGAHYEGIGKDRVNIEYLPVLEDEAGFFGNPTSDSVRAMITEETTEILLCIFAFGGTEEELEKELDRAEALLKQYCGGNGFERKILK